MLNKTMEAKSLKAT